MVRLLILLALFANILTSCSPFQSTPVVDAIYNFVLGQKSLGNNTPADDVYGQEDFTSDTSGGGLSKVYQPSQVKKINDHYYIVDSYNYRIMAIHKNYFP